MQLLFRFFFQKEGGYSEIHIQHINSSVVPTSIQMEEAILSFSSSAATPGGSKHFEIESHPPQAENMNEQKL